MKFVLLVLALIVGQVCFAEEAAVPPKAKEEAGPGRYHGRHNRNRDYKHGGDYGHKKRHYHVPLIDDYVCDLEATILVVSSKHHVKEEKSYGQTPAYGNQGGGYGNQGGDYNQGGNSYGAPQQDYNQGGNSYGAPQQDYNQGNSYGNQGGDYNQGGNSYGNQGGDYNQGGYDDKPKRHEYATPEAQRLKCSHIAVNSERDCKTCCQLSARRYHGTSRHEIFGFIVDASEIKYDDKGYVRSKRSNDYGNQPAPQNYNNQPAPPQNYGSAPAPSYDNNYSPAPQNYGSAPAPQYEAQTPGYQAEDNYQAAPSDSYAPTTYEYKRRPANARCVCCAPKANHYHRRHHDYDRSDESDEY